MVHETQNKDGNRHPDDGIADLPDGLSDHRADAS